MTDFTFTSETSPVQTYPGTGNYLFSASGTLSAAFVGMAAGGSEYHLTAATGSINGQAITGVTYDQYVANEIYYPGFSGIPDPDIYIDSSGITLQAGGYNYHWVSNLNPLYYVISDDPAASGVERVTFVLVCYGAGTLIRTSTGDVPVERLQPGDLVVTGSGAHRPVQWLGHRDIDCRGHADPHAVMPVRIAADAFAPGVPSADLMVSAYHALCVDGSLVHACALLNGSTITRVDVDAITYWHVELETHDILLANNLPAESYLDLGNRSFFLEAGAAADTPPGDAAVGSPYGFCLPLLPPGPTVGAIRQRLIERAEQLGWRRDREVEVRLRVDGKLQEAQAVGDFLLFPIPAGAQEVRLVSAIFNPARLGDGAGRDLGACLRSIVLLPSTGPWRELSLDQPALQDGLWPSGAGDARGSRWARGEVAIPRQLLAGLDGPLALMINLDRSATRRWLPRQADIEGKPPAPASAAVSKQGTERVADMST